jgi:hypothetical protein
MLNAITITSILCIASFVIFKTLQAFFKKCVFKTINSPRPYSSFVFAIKPKSDHFFTFCKRLAPKKVGINRFLDFVHNPYSRERTLKNATLRKLHLFPFSGQDMGDTYSVVSVRKS